MAREGKAKGACLIVGAGEGLGAAVGRAFAREGHEIVLTRRPRHADALEALAAEIRAQGGKAHAVPLDAREEGEIAALVDKIEADIAPLEILVFNIGANVRFRATETTTRVFTKVWEMACLGGFLAAREAARVMEPRGHGTILVTGATASLRGASGFSAFASAKNGLRAVAQSFARELGPKGIHVAHVVVDGAIDGAFTRERLADAESRLQHGEILDPQEIARNYVWLHGQGRSAWTFELDLRPWTEPW
jgi:NAD(P)-dependent dehydrogenase (short-subunit alcohol dehydrogenase family)